MSFPADVIFCHPDASWPYEQARAREFGLIVGQVYTLRKVEVGQSDTRLWLADHPSPPMGFSSVLFEPVMDEDEEPYEEPPVMDLSPDPDCS